MRAPVLDDIRHPLRRGGFANAARGSHVRRNAALLLGAGAALAAALFVRARSRQAEQENPPLGQFIEVDGVRLHYVEHGQGQPVVLLHGNGTMAQDFDLCGLLGAAARRYRVIAFDRPGFGYSERPRGTVWGPRQQAALLHRALQQLGVERPVIVAHSWGTQVALALALDFPQSVRALVLLSGYYFPTVRLDVPLLSPPAIPIVGDLLRFTVAPLIGRLIWPAVLKRIFAPARVTPSFRAFPAWMALRPSQLRASAAETALMIPCAIELSNRYHELRMPLIIMAGAGDRLVSTRRQSQRLHEELPHSELRLAPGAGHMIHHMIPHLVMEAVDVAATAE